MRNRKDSILGLIGIATKARMTVSGAEICEKSIKAGTPKLVIIAQDVTDNTKIPIERLCEHRQIKCIIFATKDELGQYTGKPSRAVVAIMDDGLANRIAELFEQEDDQNISKE